MAAYHAVIQRSVEHETVNTVWRHRPVYQQHNVLLFCFSSSLRLSNPLLRLSGPIFSEPSLCFPSPCYAFSHLVQSTPRLALSNHRLSFPLHRIVIPFISLATLPSPFHCDQLQAFPMLICAFLVIAFPSPCTRCFSLHCPRLPSLFFSILRLALALLCMSIPLLFHSECRLAIQQHVLSTLCRNHAHLSVLCHRISVRFYASSQPFGSSAQLRYPCFSFARLCNSLAYLLFASP